MDLTRSCEASVALFDSLKKELRDYLNKEEIKQIRKSFELAEAAHEGQFRHSGEPYITHPVAVAKILAKMRLDSQTIMAAIMHDVLEDTPIKKSQLAIEFGDGVAELVDGVSNLTKIKFKTKAEAQAEYFCKMVFAMAKDIRVILVKLADRTHNISTLQPLRPDKRRRIAKETLEIYAPIANRLGMNAFRLQFQEQCFEAMYPMRNKVLRRALISLYKRKHKYLSEITQSIKKQLKKERIQAETDIKKKNTYTIYQKMRAENLSFADASNGFTVRILVNSLDECYRTLGVVHNLYKPVPGTFKDYIAIPKDNGYQSLHSTLFGPLGFPIEVQIRTKQMDLMAENGIVSHWMGDRSEFDEKAVRMQAQGWAKSLLEMQKNTANSLEFIDSVKNDLLPDKVYIFTPHGRIVELLSGSTVIDFAYAVHTDIGNTCIAAKIDRQLAPLSTVLRSGQTVQVVTAPGARPNPAWLNYVLTGKAKASIRNYLKNQRQSEAITFGKRLLERALKRYDVPYNKLPKDSIKNLVDKFNLHDEDELFQEIGLGQRAALLIAYHLVNDNIEIQSNLKGNGQPLLIKGTEGVVITFAQCCSPIPGDPIVGILQAGRGVIIHREECQSNEVKNLVFDDRILVQWEENIEGLFQVGIDVSLINKPGTFAELATIISQMGSNIESINTQGLESDNSHFSLIVAIKDRKHLAKIIRRISSMKMVSNIARTGES